MLECLFILAQAVEWAHGSDTEGQWEDGSSVCREHELMKFDLEVIAWVITRTLQPLQLYSVSLGSMAQALLL